MHLLVTIGTDGPTNWVRTPDGQRFSLGSVPVLGFVTKLALGSHEARRALNGFLRGEEVMLKVDEGLMWDLLTPRRTRWAADSFIPQDQRTRGTQVMSTLAEDLNVLNQHVAALNQAAGRVSPEKMAEGVGILVKLACQLEDQAGQEPYISLVAADDESDADEAADAAVQEAEESDKANAKSAGVKLSYDVYKTNAKLAEQILDQMTAVNDKIDQIVAAGKQGFKADAARADIHAVTAKVAGITADVDLTVPWVHDDLQKLAAQASHLHSLFFSNE